jgi:hypothetical protein
MSKINFSTLDQLFFLSFTADETPEDRDAAINAYLSSVGADWDTVLDAIICQDTIIS